MATITIMSAGAVQAMVEAIGAEFARSTGHSLDLNFGTAGAMRQRLLSGAPADLVILPAAIIAALTQDGHLVPESVVDLARSVTGVVVRQGAPAPDISTPAAFRQALLDARSVSYTDPAAGGSSGAFFTGLLDRLGIAAAVQAKAVLGERGVDVAQLVADGRAEIGSTFISEILTVPDTQVVGPLPGELHNVNTYTAALATRSQAPDAARALLAALTAPATASRWTAAGLEPAFLPD